MPIWLKLYHASQESDKVRSVPYPFFAKTQSGNNQAIKWESAFNPPDMQIQIYLAIPTGGDDVIYCQAYKRFAKFEPLHQVAVYIGS